MSMWRPLFLRCMILDHKLQRMLNGFKIGQLNSESPLHQTAVSYLFELLYYFRSLRHQPLHEMFLALSTNTNSKYSGGTKYKYTLFRGPSTKYKYAFFRGFEHQLQLHIIQWAQEPNKDTHCSGGPKTK